MARTPGRNVFLDERVISKSQRILAHEFGRILGLRHGDKEKMGNLMAPPPGEELREDQGRKAAKCAQELPR